MPPRPSAWTSSGCPSPSSPTRKGRIIAAHLGELTRAEAGVILGAVRRVNSGDATPLEARADIEKGLATLAPDNAEG